MTIEEVIGVLEEDACLLYKDDRPYNRQAYDVAIRVLSQADKYERIKYEQGYEDGYKEGFEDAQQKIIQAVKSIPL